VNQWQSEIFFRSQNRFGVESDMIRPVSEMFSSIATLFLIVLFLLSAACAARAGDDGEVELRVISPETQFIQVGPGTNGAARMMKSAPKTIGGSVVAKESKTTAGQTAKTASAEPAAAPEQKKTAVETQASSGGSSRRRGGAKPADEQASEQKTESGGPDAEIETPTRNAGAPVATPAPRKPGAPTSTIITQLENHSDDAAARYTLTTILSTSRRIGDSIQTFYGMYSASRAGRQSPNSLALGYNYTHFFGPLTFGSLGYNYSLKDIGGKDDYDSVSLNLNRMFGASQNARSWYRLSAGYSAHANLKEGDVYTLGATMYIKQSEQTRFDIDYKYIYSGDMGEHVYDRYTIDYSMPAGKGKKLKIGWQFVNKAYATGTADNTDSVFRVALYSTK
jgi:hypothetical protein